MSDFDAGRASLSQPDLFKRFSVTGSGVALRDAKLDPDKQLLIFERNGKRAALIRDQMLYHHVAQGELQGAPYLITF